MTCLEIDALVLRDVLSETEERALVEHLDACPACTARTARDAELADAAVHASASVGRFRRRTRTAGAFALAAVLVGAFVLVRRPEPPPRVVVRYVIRGDATGVSLTGPGVSRRSEVRPLPQRKGDRL